MYGYIERLLFRKTRERVYVDYIRILQVATEHYVDAGQTKT